MHRALLVMCVLLILLGGCSSRQVRHLASDASLIRPGTSTVNDVLLYLGEPDGRRTVSPGVQEYVYHEDKKRGFGRAPVIGSWMSADGYEMIIITLTGDLVTGCEFRTFSEADQNWVDDFTWDEVK